MTTNKTVAVTGATGKQGGAVADQLLKAGFQVRAITRNPNSAAAEKLKQKGAEVVAADMNDIDSLKKALQGADSVFSVQNFWEKGVGYDGEIKHAKNLVDAAKSAGIKYIVQASIADTEKAPGVKHWECKAVVEDYVKKSGITYTFLGETLFMDNFVDPKNGAMMLPFISGILKKDKHLHMTAVKDIGAVALAAFQNPDQYAGTKINIAGDSLTVAEIRAIYNKNMPKKAPSYAIPSWLSCLLSKDLAKQLKWNNNPGWQFPLSETKAVIPATTSFEQFLKEHRTSGN